MRKKTTLAPSNNSDTSGTTCFRLQRLSEELVISLIQIVGDFFPSVILTLKALVNFFASSKWASSFRTKVLFQLWLVQSNDETVDGCWKTKMDCSRQEMTLIQKTVECVLECMAMTTKLRVDFDLTKANPHILAFLDLLKVETFYTGAIKGGQGDTCRLQELNISRCPNLTRVFVKNCDELKKVYIKNLTRKDYFTFGIENCGISVGITIQLEGFELKVISSKPNCEINICIEDTSDGLQYNETLTGCVNVSG